MKQIALTIIALLAAGTAWAQDDVYFVPTKKALEAERQEMLGNSSYDEIAIPAGKAFEHSNWADGRSTGGRNVDEYNRRGTAKYQSDSLKSRNYRDYDDDDYTATARIVRFRSPRACIIASPYYYDYYDLGFYDPWFDDWAWGGRFGYPYVSFGWSRGLWGASWSLGGWYSPWYYDSWYGPSYAYWNSPYYYGGWGWNSWSSPYYYGWGSPYYYDYGYRNYTRPRGTWYSGTYGSNASGRGGNFYAGGSRTNGFSGGTYYGTRSGYAPDYNRGTSRSTYSGTNYNSEGFTGSGRYGSRSSYTPANTRSYDNGTYSAPSRSSYESSSRSTETYSAPSRSGGFYSGGSRGGGFSGGGYSGGGGTYSGGGSRGGGFSSGRR